MAAFLVSVIVMLCGLAIVAADCPTDNRTLCGDNRKTFDYLLFVQEWIPGFCVGQKEPCIVPGGDPRWTMHGLWPARNKGPKGPCYCSECQFDIKQIANLTGELNYSWSQSFTKFDYYCLWKHEYEKHGTCASVLPQFKDQYDFFYGTLNIWNKMDFYSALAASGIVPSKNRTYQGSDINAAFATYFGVEPKLQCRTDNAGQYVLYQVSFCLNKSTLSPFECKGAVYQHDFCGDKVMYYPLWHNVTFTN